MTRESIEVTRQDRIYCLKAYSDYHSEVCEECKFYPNCDHMTQDDMAELTIKDLEALEQEPKMEGARGDIPIQPTVPEMPKTGHWIKRDGYWECSECHAERAYGNEYCPDCGSHNGDIAKPFKKSEVSE